MMVRRVLRTDMPRNPAAVVRALRACRGAMIEVLRTVKPLGPAYNAASAVMSAIDSLAALLTGDREYFHERGSAWHGGPSDLEEKLARETGKKPWRSPPP